MHACLTHTQDLPHEDQRQLLLSVPFAHMSLILQALPGQACMEALLSIGAPLCKDLLLSMPSPASVKLLHAASTADLAKLIQVSRLPYHHPMFCPNPSARVPYVHYAVKPLLCDYLNFLNTLCNV